MAGRAAVQQRQAQGVGGGWHRRGSDETVRWLTLLVRWDAGSTLYVGLPVTVEKSERWVAVQEYRNVYYKQFSP